MEKKYKILCTNQKILFWSYLGEKKGWEKNGSMIKLIYILTHFIVLYVTTHGEKTWYVLNSMAHKYTHGQIQ